MRYQSWGRYPRLSQTSHRLTSRHIPLPPLQPALPFGNGRSYGDSCLAPNAGYLLDARPLNRFIAFDRTTGRLRAEAGVLLSEVIDLALPQGFFLPVTPGSRFVTLGGAIANDVHGKNHHRAGSFGHHIRQFELLRSDGQRLVCSPRSNADWFAATVGGLGLTGLITWVELDLKPVGSPSMQVETTRFRELGEFHDLCQASDARFEYTVAWIDCLATGRQVGRGLFMAGNHGSALRRPLAQPPRWTLSMPMTPPMSLVNSLSLRAFNAAYYRKQWADVTRTTQHVLPFFYPLDEILHWNRLYGPKGFLQYQSVVPWEHWRSAVSEQLARIAQSGAGSFLAVLKAFGAHPSVGALSFPRPGVTLALDFPFQGQRTLDLLDQLDEVVAQAGGAIYPAKDARWSGTRFKAAYPQWEQVEAKRDPQFMSHFWQRVMAT